MCYCEFPVLYFAIIRDSIDRFVWDISHILKKDIHDALHRLAAISMVTSSFHAPPGLWLVKLAVSQTRAHLIGQSRADVFAELVYGKRL